MNDVYVAATATVSALGESLEEMWPRLCAGESALRPVTGFDTARLGFHQAACAPLDIGKEPQRAREPQRVCALMRRCLPQLGPVPSDACVIWTGVKGDAEYVEQRAAEGASQFLHRSEQYRRWVEELLDLPPHGFEVNAACAASTAGLQLGAQLIASGERCSVLVCAADIVSRFTFMGFAALQALSPTVCRPFDEARDGLCLGDGAAAVLLVDQATLDNLSRRPLARLTGWGAANDANHITGPARDGCGLIAAIEAALTRAGRRPEEIDVFCAHGTGTVFNDAMELTVIDEIFGARRFPVFSIKGAVGHTLGAAGAMEAAVVIKALSEQQAPSTAGLLQPEERAQGRVSGGVQEFSGRCALTTNSGFGGVNAALLFECASSKL